MRGGLRVAPSHVLRCPAGSQYPDLAVPWHSVGGGNIPSAWVAYHRSIPDVLGLRAWPDGRIARLGATA
jgi:hypothetical protein